LTDRFTGDLTYNAESTGTSIASTDWVEPSMDTLEFYYIKATRNICGTEYSSNVTTDTVGYYLFDYHVRPAKEIVTKDSTYTRPADASSVNLLTYYFDMNVTLGLGRDYIPADILSVDPKILAVRKWNQTSQQWRTSQKITIPIPPYYTISDPTNYIYPNDVIGLVVTSDGQYMQYGKLPRKVTTTLPTPKGSISFSYSYLYRPDRLDTKFVFDEYGGTNAIFSNIRMWDFDNQQWTTSQRMIMPVPPPNDKITTSPFNLTPLLPVSFQLNSSSPVVW
jgi:hypothetical protein